MDNQLHTENQLDKKSYIYDSSKTVQIMLNLIYMSFEKQTAVACGNVYLLPYIEIDII